jgi:hypothetical protein
MTEAEWLAATDPKPMELCVEQSTSERKLRHYLYQCVNRHRALLPDARSVNALDLLEHFADHSFSPSDQQKAISTAHEGVRAFANPLANADSEHQRTLLSAAWLVCIACDWEMGGRRIPWGISGCFLNHFEEGRIHRCQLLRDIFGNPFRPLTLNPAWLTSTVATLAQQVYDSRDFSAMPILADALQDAGCDNEQILNHCRQPGGHTRGCWVVDLLLDKK